MSNQDISLHAIKFPTCASQIFCLVVLHPINKLDSPMCGIFERNVCFCAWKLLQGSNHIIIDLEIIQLLCNYLLLIGPLHCSYFLWSITLACRSNFLALSVRVWIFITTMEFLWCYTTPPNVNFWMESSISDLKGCSENISLSAWNLCILNVNMEAHLSKYLFPTDVSYCLLLIVR